MGSEDGGQGRSKDRSPKQQLSRGPSHGVGGGLVVGIATVVVVAVAGKLFSKLRKPNGSANNNTHYITPTDSLDKIIHEENSGLQINGEGVTLPTKEISINGKSCSALDLQNADSDHNDLSTVSVAVGPLDSARTDLLTELSPRVIIGSKFSPDKLDSDDSGLFMIEHSNEKEDSSIASETALCELLNHALLDVKHESPSKHELLGNTKALQDGIVGVISRAFEDFGYGDTSSDELTPTKMTLRISWETNSSSGSEEEVAPIHKDALVAENEPLLPELLSRSTETEADEQIIERINHNAHVSQDEAVAPEPIHYLSAPIEEQEQELQGTTTTGGNETESGKPLQRAGSSVESSKSTNPEVVPVVQELVSLVDEVVDRETTVQECDHSLKHADHNQEAEVSVEETSNLLRSTECSPNEITPAKGEDSVQISTQIADEKERTTVVVTKKETTSQEECDDVQKHADHSQEAKVSINVTSNLLGSTECSPNEITPAKGENSVQISTQIADEKERTTVVVAKKETTSQEECDDVRKHADHSQEAKVSVNVTSDLLRSTESSPNEITPAKDEDFVQISTQIAEKDGMTVAVTSLMLPTTSREVTNITKIVAAQEYTVTAGTRKANVVTDAEFTSSTAGGLKRELENSWRGKWLSLEALGLTVIVALIAVLVWSIGVRGTSSVLRL